MKAKHAQMTSKRHRHSPVKRAERKATTFRFAPEVQKRLELLGRLRKMPLNRLVNVAVEQYCEIGLAEAEADLTDTLRRIRASRQAEPDFESAIADVVEAEAALATADPVEGKPVEARPAHKKAVKEGSAQAKVHQVLRA